MEQFLPRVDPVLDGQFADPTLYAILRRLAQRADIVLFKKDGFLERDYWILKG